MVARIRNVTSPHTRLMNDCFLQGLWPEKAYRHRNTSHKVHLRVQINFGHLKLEYRGCSRDALCLLFDGIWRLRIICRNFVSFCFGQFWVVSPLRLVNTSSAESSNLFANYIVRKKWVKAIFELCMMRGDTRLFLLKWNTTLFQVFLPIHIRWSSKGPSMENASRTLRTLNGVLLTYH